ncbi:MAG: sodium/proton-translocating pyrophosphatase, partial [Ferruginibacter sp.]
EGTGKPEYDKCVAISTEASLKKMMLPGAIALLSPLIIGFAFGPEVLGGFLAGATVSGVLMGMFQNNAGGAWDNAKKSFETGVEINGEMFYKKSEPHKASVTGDTVGDPFKDTSGPSMNILIKLMSIVSLVIAPTLATMNWGTAPKNEIKEMTKEVSIIKTDSANTTNLTVTADPNALKVPTDELINALAADKLIEKDNYSLVLSKGKLTLNGKEQPASVLAKYQPLIDNLDGADLKIENTQK